MTFASLSPLIERMPLADVLTRTTFEWGRIQSRADWIIPVAVLVLILVFVRWVYRRDAVDWHPLLGWFLTVLRTLAVVGLFVLYLQPQWRTERETVRNSRALLLVDTSLSMALPSAEPTAGGAASTRAEQVASALAETDLLSRLREVHDVRVLQFGDELDRGRVVSLDKLSPQDRPAADDASDAPAPAEEAVDWKEVLKPRGGETRLGQALRQLISAELDTPLSAIVVLSDGGQNAGVTPDAAVELARKHEIPIHAVGLGSDELPASVGISDLVVPARAYPGDNYVVTGFVQSQRMAGKVVAVQLLSRDAAAGADKPGTGQVEDRQQVTLGADGEVVAVRFELSPEQTGRRTLCLRVELIEGDVNTDDNFREADVEIVDRKNRVLLLAGGPTREYRFLRSLLFRDRSTTLHVLLQSGGPGISQESDELLDDFPVTREEMFQYDCVVGFDPDWQDLSIDQVELLETWVAEQGGGLIVVAGPVYAGRTIGGWVEDDAMAKVRALYPVEFHRRFSSFDEGMIVAKEPWPPEFSREGLEADFLWLADTATAGRQAWAGFEGVYAYCPVKGPKPGASVLARYSDPRSAQGGDLPVFFASQFYGSGRVFYIGSGEMWRLRASDPAYFETLYTKLIRHVSQGRLLRGSSRGVLLVGQDRYLLGNTVEVRAQLTDAQLDPLALPEVALHVALPDGAVQPMTLQADPARAGAYAGRFPATQEGSYRLELPVPESQNERLTRRIQVSVPNLERENPARNDSLLSRIAQRTGGKYYVGLGEACGTTGQPLPTLLEDRTNTVIVPEAPDPIWDRTWKSWMMWTLCGLLCLEWLIRRLFKMA